MHHLFFYEKKKLPIKTIKAVKIGKYLHVVHYKDINNWDVKSFLGKSTALKALADKINTMIHKGDAVNVEPLLKRLLNHKKKLNQPSNNDNKKFMGYGHFRWNYQCYELTPEELQRVKNYFKL